MEHIRELIRARKSVRSFDGAPLRDADREKLAAYLAQIETPFDLPMDFRILDAKEHGLSSPVVTGTELYAAGKLRRGPMAEIAFGFAFEKFVLYALSLGIGTVMLAASLKRSAFEKAIEVGDEVKTRPCGFARRRRSIGIRAAHLRQIVLQFLWQILLHEAVGHQF